MPLVGNSKFFTESVALTTTSDTDIYTVPARFNADINSIYVNNESSSAVTFSLDWYDAASIYREWVLPSAQWT